MITLQAPIGNLLANKIKVVSELVKIEVKHEDIDISQTHSKEFLEKNPLGQIPLINTKDGTLCESNAILRYIARLGKSQINLYGSDEQQAGQIDQWLDFVACEVQPLISAMIKPIIGWIPAYCDVLKMQKEAKQDMFKVLKYIDDQLKMNSFLVGNSITLADISLHGSLVSLYRFCLEEKLRNTYGNVTRWFETISAKPEFIKYYGKYFPCKKEWVCQEVKKDQQQQQQKEKEKEKPAALKKQDAKPQEKKPKTQEKENEEEKEEKKEEEKEEVITGFNLYKFKDLIVNTSDKKQAVEFMFQNIEPEKFSLWYVTYVKSEGQGQILWQTESLMDGMLKNYPQLDSQRKLGYGTHYILGDIPNLEIRGVWLWQGQEVPQDIRELQIYEYHNWKKLDVKKQEDRNLIMEYWTKRKVDEDFIEGLRLKYIVDFR